MANAERTATAPASPGGLKIYKPGQGWATRTGTFVSAGLLVAWGAWFLSERLAVYEGTAFWQLAVSKGIPLLFLAAALGACFWATYLARRSSDFMIATEGEMKKVNWSSRREIIGSTKVVILLTFVLAVILFVVDVAFQALFTGIGVLRTS